MLPESDLQRALTSLPRIPLSGPWTRILASHLLQDPPPDAAPGAPPQPLWAGGPRLKGARFSPPGGFDSLYLASDAVTALEEVGAIFRHEGTPPFTLRTPPWTLFAVDGIVEEVLDLADPRICRRLGTSGSELTGDWRLSQGAYLRGAGPLPPTQRLGKAAYESGRIAGMRYPSAKTTGSGISFVIFPERLAKGSFLEVYDPHGKIRQRLP